MSSAGPAGSGEEEGPRPGERGVRDPFFGEPVVWSGRPRALVTPIPSRLAAAACALASAVAVASAVVVARGLSASPAELLAFAAWMATLSLALSLGPRWWKSELEYSVTSRHVVVRRGRLRRTIDRREISFARVRWLPRRPGVGDLELVRSVPTGALRRGLSVVLVGVAHPDRVWAIVRGAPIGAATGDGERLLAQRLDPGERVLWSGGPSLDWRRWLPRDGRALGSLGLSALTLGAAALVAARAARALAVVRRAGIDSGSVAFIALVLSLALTLVAMVLAAGLGAYVAIVLPARLDRRTRYLVTDRRVLIQRGREELHLERSRIAEVVDAPGAGALRDVFLVLDGPSARAFASSGAFGERGPRGLLPVLRGLQDADAALAALRSPPALPEPASVPADSV